MSKTFFISDTHFGHANVIRFDKRPFADVDQMNEEMIARWNKVVGPDDTIYHLGDFSFLPAEKTLAVLRRLNGQKHLIYGNHDQIIRKNHKLQREFVSVSEYKEITVAGNFFCLFHFPIGEWNKAHRGAYHLHGHCHGNYVYPRPGKNMDVGAPCVGYTPIEAAAVIARLKNAPDLQHH